MAWCWFPETVSVCLLLLVNLVIYVTSGQLQRKMEVRLWARLAAAPLFIVWKLYIYVTMVFDKKNLSWNRTIRQAELEETKR